MGFLLNHDLDLAVTFSCRLSNSTSSSFWAGFDFKMKWNEYMDIHPRALISINDISSEPWPMTFWLDILLPELFTIKPSL